MTTKASPLECIHYHLQGLGRTNPLRLADVANYESWLRLVRVEQDRRRSQVLLGLTDSELAEIADGHIHLDKVAAHVLATLEEVAD